MGRCRHQVVRCRASSFSPGGLRVISPFGVLRAALAMFAVTVLAACGGGGGSSAVPSAGPSPASLISQNGNNITLTGYISAISAQGLNVYVGGPGGYGNVRVFTNSSTAITATIALNVRVLVIGTGTLASGITATSIATETSASRSLVPRAPPPAATTGNPPSPAPTGAVIALPGATGTWGGSIVAKGVGVL